MANLRREFKPGTKVHLDKDLGHNSIVEVVEQTPKKFYTMVKDEDSTWAVMTYRLSPIESNSKTE